MNQVTNEQFAKIRQFVIDSHPSVAVVYISKEGLKHVGKITSLLIPEQCATLVRELIVRQHLNHRGLEMCIATIPGLNQKVIIAQV